MTDLQDKLLMSVLNDLRDTQTRLDASVDKHDRILAVAAAQEAMREADRQSADRRRQYEQRRREGLLMIAATLFGGLVTELAVHFLRHHM